MAVDLGYDEGGAGDSLLVSVQLGITEQLKKFRRRWRSRLGPLEFFHSKDYGNFSYGVFTEAGLGRDERKELLWGLTALIHRYFIGAITARVNQELYDKMTTQEFRSKYGTAYGFLVDMCLLMSYVVMTDLQIRPHFNILIEDGHRNASQVISILETIKTNPGEQTGIDMKILSAGLGSKKGHPILQAADMLAYAQWQRICQKDRSIWDALSGHQSKYFSVEIDCDEHLIREFVAGPGRFAEKKQQEWRDRRDEKRKNADAIKGIRELRPHDAGTD